MFFVLLVRDDKYVYIYINITFNQFLLHFYAAIQMKLTSFYFHNICRKALKSTDD